MHNAYVVTGTVTDKSTVTLDEELPVSSTKVRLIVEPLGGEVASGIDSAAGMTPKRPLLEVMEEIWAGQRARGHIPRTKEEVDAYIQGERDSWED
jgi:hypothetical protein